MLRIDARAVNAEAFVEIPWQDVHAIVGRGIEIEIVVVPGTNIRVRVDHEIVERHVPEGAIYVNTLAYAFFEDVVGRVIQCVDRVDEVIPRTIGLACLELVVFFVIFG